MIVNKVSLDLVYFQKSFNWTYDVTCLELHVNRVSHCFTLYCSAVHKYDYWTQKCYISSNWKSCCSIQFPTFCAKTSVHSIIYSNRGLHFDFFLSFCDPCSFITIYPHHNGIKCQLYCELCSFCLLFWNSKHMHLISYCSMPSFYLEACYIPRNKASNRHKY